MKKDVKSLLADLFGRFALAFLLFYSFSRIIWEAFALNSLKTAGMIQLITGATLCFFLCTITEKRVRVITYIALSVVLALFAIVASRYVSDGWNVVFNRIFSGFELRYGRIFPYFKARLTKGDIDLCAAAFLLYPTAFLALCSARAVTLRTAFRFVFLFLAVLLWVGAVLFRLPVPVLPLILFVIAMAGMRARSIMLKTTNPGGGKAILPVLLSLTLITGFFAVPLASLTGSRELKARNLRDNIAEAIHDARYHISDPDIPEGDFTRLPEGDFTKLGNFEPQDGAALYVKTGKPIPMYLRGYMGDVYTGYGWKKFRPETLGKYATAFSWMHSANFYGQTQYAALAEALGVGEAAPGISIENISACSAYEFMPYSLNLSLDEGLDKNAVGDFYIRSKGFYGERNYKLTASAYPIEDYNLLYDMLVEADRAGSLSAYEYLRYEGAYREFVYNEYLTVPASVHASIRKLPEVMGVPEGVQVSFGEACRIVLNSLLNNYAYNETPGKTPEGWDFSLWFLSGSKSGYAPHFATAAVLMFRDLGIPARYVEGYAIRDEEVRTARAGRMEVPKANAHAWVEIYRDGVGFVPFEVTPPFVTDAPLTSSSQSGGSGSSGELEKPQENPETASPRTLTQILRTLLVLLALMLAAALVSLFVRRHILKKRREELFENPDNGEAVCWLVAYGMLLIEQMGVIRRNNSLFTLVPEIERVLGTALAADFTAVVNIQRGAMFSKNPVPDDQRAAVRAFTDEVLRHLKQTCGLKERLRLKWIKCLY